MARKSTLTEFLTRSQIERLAHGASFERGEDYLAAGRVRSLVEHNGRLTATVSGTRDYKVRLCVAKGEMDYSCSCPVGAEGLFCKHCVATALAWRDEGRGVGKTKEAQTPVVKLDDVRGWLGGQKKETLAGWLLEAAERDGRLRQKLFREAARASKKGIDLNAYCRAIDLAADTGGFVEYREAYDFALGLGEAIEPLGDLLEEGHAAEVVELAEHALRRVEKALHQADDSDGALGSLLGDLQQIHLEACRKARPDPEELAARLFEWEMSGDWEVFLGAAETYAAVLGKKGFAVYRDLARAKWEKMPPLKPGQREDWSGGRFRITHIMEALARADGGLEALVAVKAKNLSLAWHFLEIAQLYQGAKRHDAALDWAEQGLKAFPKETDSRLREFLAVEYHRRKRHDDAMALIWQEFDERPNLANYQLLKKHADRAKSWTVWREQALARLQNHVAASCRNEGKGVAHWLPREGRSELVRVFLWEKTPEAAWREAQAGGCTGSLWLELAAAREKDHPQDAAPIYLREAEKLIPQKHNQAYAEAAKLLAKARGLFLRLGEQKEWSAAIARLRAEHKPKRNFIALAAKL